MAKKVISKKSTVSTKKTAPKTSVPTRSQVQSHAVKKSTASTKKPTEKIAAVASPKSSVTPKEKRTRKMYIVLAVAILVVGALLYLGRGFFVAAVVNGQPISRLSIIQESEKQSGRQALDTIVRNTLIEQEARKANVSVSEKEIDEEIKKVEGTLSQQGQKLDDVLAMQGMTKEDLRRLIRLDKLVTKIVGKDVKVTDEEITKYLEENQELLPQDQSEEQLRKDATERLKQEKLNEKVRTWLESLQTKAKIMYFVQY